MEQNPVEPVGNATSVFPSVFRFGGFSVFYAFFLGILRAESQHIDGCFFFPDQYLLPGEISIYIGRRFRCCPGFAVYNCFNRTIVQLGCYFKADRQQGDRSGHEAESAQSLCSHGACVLNEQSSFVCNQCWGAGEDLHLFAK